MKTQKTNKTLRHQRFTALILSLPLLFFVTMAGWNHSNSAAGGEPAVARAALPGSSSTPVAQPAAKAPAATDTLWLDVRTPEEFESGHLAAATNVPLDLFGDLLPSIEPNKERTIALYCRSGRRSGRALEIARSLGYANAFNAGGYETLKASRK